MFYIDGISLNKIKDELNSHLVGRKVTKFNQNTELSLSIFFGKVELLFSCNPNFTICYINENKDISLEENSNNLISTLKKHLLGGILVDVEQLGYDRVLKFNFSKINELGECKKYSIYFELMGKYSNFVFVDENNRIIELLKRFSLEENRLRELFPTAIYTQPVISKKISPEKIEKEQFVNLGDKLLETVEGVGKLFVKNVKNYDEYISILKKEITPKIYMKSGKIVLGTVLEIVPEKEWDKVLEFATYKEIINYYINYQKLSNSFNILKTNLVNVVNKNLKKLEKVLKILEKELEENKNYYSYKEMGDILASVLYSVKYGQKSIVTYDFYNDREIEIPLVINKSPQENLELIYKKYNKMKKTVEYNGIRKREVLDEIGYFNSVMTFIETSENSENLTSIYEELVEEKYIPKEKNNKKKKEKKSQKYGIIEKDDYTIIYGRNNIENEFVTFKLAEKNDLWLHSKDIPGAHVIIKSAKVTNEMIFEGAKVASYYTRANIGEKISVDYTLKKYINKPKGNRIGFVTYSNEKNILVEKVEKLEI